MGLIYKSGELYGGFGGVSDAGFTPVGTIIPMMSNHAPANYLVCDGTIYNIADYSELANHFYTEFGSKNYFGGDGTVTFAVPDLRGEFLRGTGTNSHNTQGNGSNVGVHQDATEHFFSIKTNQTRINFYGTTPTMPQNIDGTASAGVTKEGMNVSATAYTASSDTTTCYKSRPTNTSVLYCIATKNIYLDPSLDYSTEERVVGTWVNGKPLYQKTLSGVPMPQCVTEGTQVASQTSLNISNVDLIFLKESYVVGLASDGNFTSRTFPYMINSGNTIKAGVFGNTANNKSLQLLSNTKSFNNCLVYVTVQYTKTTD